MRQHVWQRLVALRQFVLLGRRSGILLPPVPYWGNSIVVRHILPDDMPVLHDWLKSSDFSNYRPSLGEMCPDVSSLIGRMAAIAQFSPPIEVETLIMHRATMSPIGVMALSGIDPVNRKAEFSIGFVRGQGTRCTMEALHFGLEQAFSTLNLRKLAFYVAVGNEQAQRFMLHRHMRDEGLLREELLRASGETLDLQRYALLRAEWENGELRRKLQRLAPLA
jgi:RimJ/RimL family protein N-acetyltransferase